MTAARTGLMLAMLLATAVTAADPVRRERVELADGSGTATLEGTVKGYESVEYQVAAGAGQQMTISLSSDNASTHYNLYAPGDIPGESTAVHNAAREGLDYQGTLEATGDYTIQLFLTRAAARRAEQSAYALSVALSGEATPRPETDAQAPGTEFHATGELRCAVGAGRPMAACPFGVVREGGGTATVHVTQPQGASRTIRFDGGRAVSSQPPGRIFSAMRQGDDTIVTIDDERYEIPDVVPVGE